MWVVLNKTQLLRKRRYLYFYTLRKEYWANGLDGMETAGRTEVAPSPAASPQLGYLG